MPQGQFLGSRAPYIYESDSGQQYLLLLDTTLATLANTGLVAATATNAAGATPRPLRFKPRGVWWQSTTAGTPGRKFLICGDVTAGLYASQTSQAVTIDGIAGVTTGRVGEQLTYVRLPSGT